MRKITLLIVLLLSGLSAYSQNPGTTFPAERYRYSAKGDSVLELRRSMRDSVIKAIRQHKPIPFGYKLMVFGEFYDAIRKDWATGPALTIENNRFDALDKLLAAQNPKVADSIKQWNPNSFLLRRMRSKIMLGVELNPTLTDYYSYFARYTGRKHPRITIRDSSAAAVFAMGINANNVKLYRYHVVLDDSTEIVPWSIPALEQKNGATHPYGVIGHFKQPGKQVVIEVVNINDYNDRTGMILDWRAKHDPELVSFSGSAYGMGFSLNNTKRGYSRIMDKRTSLPLDLKFPARSMTEFSFMFRDHPDQPYYLIALKLGGERPMPMTTEPIRIDGNEYVFKNDLLNQPGKYRLVIVNSWQNQSLGALYIPFTVLPPIPEAHKYTFEEIKNYAIAALVLVVLIIIGIIIYSKRKVRAAQRQKAMAGLRLSAISSQLNPHFMFNALTSIQNLVNQHDMAGANNYLSKFAGLTRQVLNTGGQELISLEDELHIIEDYLQIEQLRFGFAYSITVGYDINRANTEIPAMLLQPFIENAAKHGVSALKKYGKISIDIVKDWQHLVITIADNGPGFGNTGHVGNGVGLKLTDERIALLNQLYKDQPIDYKLSSNNNGATVTITLTNWA